jgi:hypothetical protein
MDGTGHYYIKWNETDSEKLCFLSYVESRFKKTQKQKEDYLEEHKVKGCVNTIKEHTIPKYYAIILYN